MGAAAALLMASPAHAKETLLTFELPAGQEQCFYEDVRSCGSDPFVSPMPVSVRFVVVCASRPYTWHMKLAGKAPGRAHLACMSHTIHTTATLAILSHRFPHILPHPRRVLVHIVFRCCKESK